MIKSHCNHKDTKRTSSRKECNRINIYNKRRHKTRTVGLPKARNSQGNGNFIVHKIRWKEVSEIKILRYG